MLELETVQIGKFVKNTNEKGKALIKRVVYQTFWLIGSSQ